MRLPLLQVLLAAALPLALAQAATNTTTTTTPSSPRPTPNEVDPCLQRKFLSALICSDVNPTWTNETLAADGWLCCWEQSISAPGNLKISAWLDVDEKGDTVQRCLHRGGCVNL